MGLNNREILMELLSSPRHFQYFRKNVAVIGSIKWRSPISGILVISKWLRNVIMLLGKNILMKREVYGT